MGLKRFTLSIASVVVLALMAAWTVGSALLIACPPDYCELVLCAKVKAEDCPPHLGRIEPNGGFCGCCPTCLTYIGENESCIFTIGLPETSVCGEGLICQDGSCKKLPSDI